MHTFLDFEPGLELVCMQAAKFLGWPIDLSIHIDRGWPNTILHIGIRVGLIPVLNAANSQPCFELHSKEI